MQDSTYIKHAYAQHGKDWIKVLSARPNPFLATILNHEQRDAALQRHTQSVEKLESEGIKPLNKADKFEKAGMSDEYRSIYHFESDEIHNSWRALLSRHFEKLGD